VRKGETWIDRKHLLVLTNDLPFFNTPLRRLALAIRRHEGVLRLLDIGANIGEGLALVDPQPADRFWLVEGSSEFLPYLRRNSGGYSNAVVVNSYLGERHAVLRGSEVVTAGNSFIQTEGGGELVFETLDRLFPEASLVPPNLLKIDVEGHEARIFAGGENLLLRDKPIIFMEWHPRLLWRESADVFASLEHLIGAGYEDALVYDNHGFLFGGIALSDRTRLEELAQYARMRDLFYFDLAVFGPNRVDLRDTFKVAEKSFYENLIRA